MFKEWDFLLAEIWGLLALAALIGLVAGWLIWGGRSKGGRDDVRRLRAELDRAKAQNRASVADPLDDIPAMQGGGYTRPSRKAEAHGAPVPEPDTVDQDANSEPEPAQIKPQTLEAARDGVPDDLTRISGIGRKMETLCNRLGFYHFDQIAAWTEDEVAWVDDNLEGFKGRVTRDNWVKQAQTLSMGQTTPAFVRRKD